MPFLWRSSAKKSTADALKESDLRPPHVEDGLTQASHADISEACKRTDVGLWDAYARGVGRNSPNSDAGRLVFPQYRDKGLRVSEQEARFAFVEALSQGPLRYSVEAPTRKLYSFSGRTPLSAQTDLQLHGENKTGICNVEFKAKGVSASAQDNFSIYKDVQKLLREPTWGLWFHLLEGIDNSTISKFLDVMVRQIAQVQSDFARDIETPGLSLHICVLRHRFSLHKDLPFPSGGGFDISELVGQLTVDLHVSRNELREVLDLNEWGIHR